MAYLVPNIVKIHRFLLKTQSPLKKLLSVLPKIGLVLKNGIAYKKKGRVLLRKFNCKALIEIVAFVSLLRQKQLSTCFTGGMGGGGEGLVTVGIIRVLSDP